MATELKLSDELKENITIIYDNMKKKAVELGQEIVNIEKIANDNNCC